MTAIQLLMALFNGARELAAPLHRVVLTPEQGSRSRKRGPDRPRRRRHPAADTSIIWR
jgi:hypothetical protein